MAIKTPASAQLGFIEESYPEPAPPQANPETIEKAVKGMLPRNPLGRAMFGKLRVYAGAEHPHTAQQPRPLEL